VIPAAVTTVGRDVVSRAVRQALQTLIPTLLVVAAGSTAGIDVGAVGVLAGITVLVGLLASVAGLKAPADSPLWLTILDRAGKAAAGTALGFLTVDGVTPVTVIEWDATVTATLGAAALAVVMLFTNPPPIVGDVIDIGDPAADRGAVAVRVQLSLVAMTVASMAALLLVSSIRVALDR
jgi:hypothetical protein